MSGLGSISNVSPEPKKIWKDRADTKAKQNLAQQHTAEIIKVSGNPNNSELLLAGMQLQRANQVREQNLPKDIINNEVKKDATSPLKASISSQSKADAVRRNSPQFKQEIPQPQPPQAATPPPKIKAPGSHMGFYKHGNGDQIAKEVKSVPPKQQHFTRDEAGLPKVPSSPVDKLTPADIEGAKFGYFDFKKNQDVNQAGREVKSEPTHDPNTDRLQIPPKYTKEEIKNGLDYSLKTGTMDSAVPVPRSQEYGHANSKEIQAAINKKNDAEKSDATPTSSSSISTQPSVGETVENAEASPAKEVKGSALNELKPVLLHETQAAQILKLSRACAKKDFIIYTINKGEKKISYINDTGLRHRSDIDHPEIQAKLKSNKVITEFQVQIIRPKSFFSPTKMQDDLFTPLFISKDKESRTNGDTRLEKIKEQLNAYKGANVGIFNFGDAGLMFIYKDIDGVIQTPQKPIETQKDFHDIKFTGKILATNPSDNSTRLLPIKDAFSKF